MSSDRNCEALPDWMLTAGKMMRERADRAVKRPKFTGPLSAEKIRDFYSTHTAKQMEGWIAARDGREDEESSSAPQKEDLFREMYPVLSNWMDDKGFCIKTTNTTAKAKALIALAKTVKVNDCTMVAVARFNIAYNAYSITMLNLFNEYSNAFNSNNWSDTLMRSCTHATIYSCDHALMRSALMHSCMHSRAHEIMHPCTQKRNRKIRRTNADSRSDKIKSVVGRIILPFWGVPDTPATSMSKWRETHSGCTSAAIDALCKEPLPLEGNVRHPNPHDSKIL